MEFKFRAIDEQASTYQPRSSTFSYFTEQALRAGYKNSDYGRAHQFLRNPIDVRETIQRELVKERIREEIIAAEIAKRRLLEAEVRREMMVEREMALQRADRFSFLPERMSILHKSEGRSLEERIALSLEERLGLFGRRQIGGFETTPFQRNVEPTITEVKPLSEAKPVVNISGAKRKAVTPPAVGASELPLIGWKKKPKEEWSCAICQVSATSERALNEHLQGKRHKTKEAALIAEKTGKNFGLGLPKKASKPAKLKEITDDPSSENGEKIKGKSLQVNKIGESSLQKSTNTKCSKKNDEPLPQENQDADDTKKKMKNDEPLPQKNQDADDTKKKKEAWLKMQKTVEYRRKKSKFWCEMCLTGAYSEKVMENHKNGRKHVSRLQELKQNGGVVPGIQMVEASKEHDAEQVVEDGKRGALEKVDGAVNGVEAQDHQAAAEVAANGSD